MAKRPFPRIQISAFEGRAQSVRLRQTLFHSLYDTLRSSEASIRDAIAVDSGYGDAEVDLQYALAIAELRAHYQSLDLEAALNSQKLLENPIATTNVGIVYLVPSSHDLFYAVLSALTAALAAGNCVIVELPQTYSQVSGLLRKLLPAALDADVFAVSDVRPSDDFLARCHLLIQSPDHDSTAEQKSQAQVIAIVDRTADISDAASALATSRFSFHGAAAYGPDVVLVDEFTADELISRLTLSISSPVLKSSTTASGPTSHRQKVDATTLRTNDNYKVLISGDLGTILEITNRDNVSVGTEIRGRVICIYRTTSLEDAIDVSSSLASPLEASYLFAAPAAATYLAKHIDARISCVDHIPPELLVGPFAPPHPSVPARPSPRHDQALFRSPRPRILHKSALTMVLDQDVQSKSSRSLQRWTRSVLDQALPPLKQRPGKAYDFFDQAFIIIGVSVLSTVAAVGFTTYRYIRSR